jgi:hypothetical protein
MNKLLKISALIIVLILSACSSDDELEPEYTGPWKIEYAEYYRGLHTSDPAFKVWFQNHVNNFDNASFRNYSQTKETFYSREAGDWIEWSDYTTWYEGAIEWSEIVESASESEIKMMIDRYKSFTVEDDQGRVDYFDARYRKQPKVE